MLKKETPFLFRIDELESIGVSSHNSYINAEPFRHAIFENFLPKKEANKALKFFPKPSSEIWLDWTKRDTVHQPKKQGVGHASRLKGVDPDLLNLLNAFNSYPFLNFLEQLTGINKLLPDPYFHGGALHQILNGGKLAVHTDFNDLKKLDIYRRINVLFYLNKNWKNSYNGDLELWSTGCKERVTSIPPSFNKLVVFDTDKNSFHGHPIPLNTPDDITRKSIALYYYTAQPAKESKYDSNTDWQETT